MAKAKKVSSAFKKKPIEQYDHKGKKRVNNPPVGLVTPDTDNDSGKKTYAYDPHLDPQLIWRLVCLTEQYLTLKDNVSTYRGGVFDRTGKIP